jgi:hypothetical protein
MHTVVALHIGQATAACSSLCYTSLHTAALLVAVHATSQLAQTATALIAQLGGMQVMQTLVPCIA